MKMFPKIMLLSALLPFLMWSCGTETEENLAVSEMGKACCEVQGASMKGFLQDESFINSHQNPLKINYTPIEEGKEISFDTPDGQKATAFAFMSKKKSDKYLFVIHEWWGLNDYVKREAEKFFLDLQKKNVNVIALDLYDGKVAQTREDAAKYMQENTAERSANIIKGLVNFTGKKAKIATIGWCFGGGWSLQASLLAEKQAVGCIIYYGMPEKDKEKLGKLNAEVLGIFAGQEKWINKEVVDGFEKNLKDLKKKNTIKIFDAEHAFANPSNPKYNETFAKEAYTMSLNFLKKKF